MGRARSRLLVTAVDSDSGDDVDAAVAVLLRAGRAGHRSRPRTADTDPARLGCWRRRRWSAGCARWCARRRTRSMTRYVPARQRNWRGSPQAGVPGADPAQWYGMTPLSTDEPLWDGDDHVVTLSPSTLQTLTDCPLRWLLERHGGTDGRDVRSAVGSLVHALVADPAKTESQMLTELEKLWSEAAVRFAVVLGQRAGAAPRDAVDVRAVARADPQRAHRGGHRDRRRRRRRPADGSGPGCGCAAASTGWNATARAGWWWSTSRPARPRSARTTRNATPSWRCTSWPSRKACCRRVIQPGGGRLVYLGKTGAGGADRTRAGRADRRRPRGMARAGAARGGRHPGAGVPRAHQRRLCALPGAGHVPRPGRRRWTAMTPRYSPAELAAALGLFAPTEEQAAVIAAPPGPLVVIAGAGAGKTETMAARVVWLVANGYARPGEVLGLTFTRKAAGQLLRRVRTRLARLAGAGLVPGGRRRGRRPGDRQHLPRLRRQRCCASTACCCRSSPTPGCSAKPSCGSWRFASCANIPARCDTDKTPAAVTAMVLRLAGQLAEHLVDTDQLRDTHVELERLVHTLPAGPVSARPRAQPVAAADAGHPDRAHRAGAADRRAARTHARREGHGLRHADGLGRPAGVDVPAGRRAAAAAVPGGAARRVPGHRPRPAGRVVVAVRRRRRRRAGADRRRRSDPVDLRLARRLGDQPAAVHHRLPALGRNPGAHAGAAHQLAQSAPGAAPGQRGVRRRPGAARSRCGRCGRGPTPNPAPSGARCCPTSRPNGIGWQTIWRGSTTARAADGRPRRRRRCWCAATPMPRRWPTR